MSKQITLFKQTITMTLAVAVVSFVLLFFVNGAINEQDTSLTYSSVEVETISLLSESKDFEKRLPRLNLPASSLFIHEVQVSPNLDEIPLSFEDSDHVRFYKLAKNPKEPEQWFLNISSSSAPSRVSAWQESNLLYSHPIYLS